MKHDNVYIALGTNLGEREKNLVNAILNIEGKIGEVLKVSEYIETEPWGYQSDEKFLNAVIMVKTDLGIQDLLRELQNIESFLGREKQMSAGYEDRIIDLDIIDYKGEVKKDEMVEVPHPRMFQREFVLKPLFDVDPNWVHPQLERSIKDLLQQFQKESPQIA